MGETQATKEAIWLNTFLGQITRDKPSKPVVIYGDNQGAIALAKNPQFYGRTKHIDIAHHFVREKVADGSVDLRYVPTEKQIADGLTKALPRDRFEAFRKLLGLEEPPIRKAWLDPVGVPFGAWCSVGGVARLWELWELWSSEHLSIKL